MLSSRASVVLAAPRCAGSLISGWSWDYVGWLRPTVKRACGGALRVTAPRAAHSNTLAGHTRSKATPAAWWASRTASASAASNWQ